MPSIPMLEKNITNKDIMQCICIYIGNNLFGINCNWANKGELL